MLTARQAEVLDFIARHLNEKGYSPTYDEIMEEIGCASKSNIHRLIASLVERGYVRQLKHRARAIEVIRNPSHAIGPVTEDYQRGYDAGFQAGIKEGLKAGVK